MGARRAVPTRLCSGNVERHPRQRGGQHTLTIHGCPGVTAAEAKGRTAAQDAPEGKAPSLSSAAPCRPQPQTPRLSGSQPTPARPVLVALHAPLRLPRCWEQPAAVPTPAMCLAALAADERERTPAPDLGEFARPMAWGHTETALAIEG